MCDRHHVQACHCCERLACGDNTSPGAELYRAAKVYQSAVSHPGSGNPIASLRDLAQAVKKLEEMG
jgi:hypothetical protein